jgi:NhaP-type Na+/H+ or K+/H+ antiporter
VFGYVTFRLLRSVNNYPVEVLLTLAAVTGGYVLALSLPAVPRGDIVLALTCCIVALSILGQGASIGAAVRKAATSRD